MTKRKAPEEKQKAKAIAEVAAQVVADLVVERAESAGPGRPTDYDPKKMPEQAEKLCVLGATDEEIADFFGVSARTIYRWKIEHPEFCQAVKSGKENADERVERSLYQKATGYYFVEQESHKLKIDQHKEEIEVVDVEKFATPDTTAAIFWLKNRRKDVWRDKQEVEHTASKDLIDALDARRKRARGGQ